MEVKLIEREDNKVRFLQIGAENPDATCKWGRYLAVRRRHRLFRCVPHHQDLQY
jgi:transposase